VSDENTFLPLTRKMFNISPPMAREEEPAFQVTENSKEGSLSTTIRP
jgi:hypothetical protein